MRVGLAGLGVMGYRIGANLVKAGKLDVVYNRTVSRAEQFSKEYGVKYVTDPKELIKSVDLLITMLADDSAVSSFLLPLSPYAKDKIIVDMSTISPSTSISIANEIMKNGGMMYDAPVIGTSIFAEQKKLTVLLGGPESHVNTVTEILKETASTIIYMGKNGMGLYAKLVNNLMVGVYVAALAEAYNFGISAGLKPEDVHKVLALYGSAKSPTSELKVPKMMNSDYSTQFATKHMRKDLEIITKETQNLHVVNPLSSLALQLYRFAEALGYSESDYAAVLEVYKKANLVKVK
ncbi:NAD(P)-dependent oxidoreductase [Sulfurisphaera tokodaii]|uniref:3-hydroxyisobutyrate dehydrogenase n=2 Tax=Sulfurisphaera tokodaii TaxID=111955 RepID=Q974P0_SULTO|nr:NAD(P)-dependent oxidoreductase [Sulfurisphaera tokodaii]BAB65617.1 putative 3-hydroxyisobutyrate dehydrogenase [Sulfurisphaera tokodaii str. 7]HII74679.1 NAD(P)-dependent oxidoreductase [Sulfurisphaera tokodaii]